jgi:hypothetical protein
LQPAQFARGGSVPGYAEGGLMDRLRNLLKGDDYQSTGQKTVNDDQVNWGDPDSAADFFRADKARTALDKARNSVANIERASAAPRAPAVVADRAEAEPVLPDLTGLRKAIAVSRTIPGAQPPMQSNWFEPFPGAKPTPYGALIRGAQGMQLPAAQPPASRGALGAIAQAAQEQQPEKPMPYSRWPMGNDRYRDVNDWTPAEVLGLMRAKRSMGETVTGYAHGGSVPGYAKGGFRDPNDPLGGLAVDPNDPNQWLQFGGQDTQTSPAGLPIGQAAETSIPYHILEGLGHGAELTKRASEGEMLSMRDPETFEKVFSAAGTPMAAGFGLSHVVGPAMKSGETMLGMAVKPKGGNWLANSIEAETQGLKNRDIMEALRAPADMPPPNHAVTDSINNWVDKKLNKYIRNEMATPEDPIRLLAEQGTLHVNPENLYPTFRNYPNQQLHAQSREAKVWEDLSDRSLKSDSAKERIAQGLKEENPWLEKVSPDTPVYGIKDSAPYFELNRDLGFDHLVDELRNAVRHDSDLPANLRLSPEKLDKVSVPQAVELVSKINKWREDAAGRALAKNANNDATHLVKEYPEAGYKWVELKPPTAVSEEVLSSLSAKERELFNHYVEAGDTPYEALQGVTGASDNPTLAAALKYEGDMMGHCVGGYCDDVERGVSRIFSLRDSKGRPHVTIETEPQIHFEGIGNAINKIEPNLWEKMVDEGGHYDYNKWLKENRPDVYKELNKENIVQVKGKGNAKPKDEYLPFVQDFIRSQEWGKIGDHKNIDMVRLKQPVKVGDNFEVPPGYYTQNDIKNLLKEKGLSEQIPYELLYGSLHYQPHARGGPVQGYATGGPVDDSIEALYNKYTGHGSDAAGKAWWQQQTAGMTPEEQDAAFLKGANAAYASNAAATGPVSDAQIQNLYQQYAGRAADQGGLDYWKQQAAAPGVTYADLSNQFRQGVANAGDKEQVQTVKAPPWLEKFDYENFDNPLDAGLDYLKRTLGDKAAAALYGQFNTESYGNPQQLQTAGGPNGRPLFDKFTNMPLGMGLAQWSPLRQNNLYQFADKYGVDPNSTEGQLRFAVNELTTDPFYNKWLQRVQNPNVNLAGATQILGKKYEAPDDLSATIAKRKADADMLSRYMNKGTLTPDEQAKIANMKSGMQDPLFASKMAARQDLIAKNAAAEKAKLAGTADILPDTGFNPFDTVSTTITQPTGLGNDALMQQLNNSGTFADPNNLNTGLTPYTFGVTPSSGGPGLPFGTDQQNGISLMPGFEPLARGGRVMGYAEGGSFQPMFEGDSETLQARAKQLAKQAYSDPRSLSPEDMKEWNLLAGRYNLPFSAQNPMSYEDEMEQRNNALERNLSAKERRRTYARGGAVDAYDPAEIDAIAAQIRGAA